MQTAVLAALLWFRRKGKESPFVVFVLELASVARPEHCYEGVLRVDLSMDGEAPASIVNNRDTGISVTAGAP